MPTSHTYTVGAVPTPLSADDEEEDSDICPVCEGECICHHNSRALAPPPFLDGHAQSAVSTMASSSTTPVPPSKPILPSLKIRLTVPQSMLGKKRAPTSQFKKPKNLGGTTFAIVNDDEYVSSPFSAPGKALLSQSMASTSRIHADVQVPKRRGRPPKAVVAARELAAKAAETQVASSSKNISPLQPKSRLLQRKPTIPKNKMRPTVPKLQAKFKARGTTVKSSGASSKRRRVESSESSSELSDIDQSYGYDDDGQSVQFPTFMSASALSSLSSGSSSDSSSSSGFDTDSSIEAEEENFIVTEESRGRDKARMRRELLGEEGQKKGESQNDWVIRPRKKSEGLSDVDMDGDTDATEDEDEEEEDEEVEDDEEETDDLSTGTGYVGLATGWSEDDEEDSFDADLFFANLSDSEDRSGSSAPSDDEGGEDGDQSDLETMSHSEASLAALFPHLRQNLENLPFEATESWDGQIVFSNGLTEGQGIIDMDFEVNAAQFVAEASPEPSQDSDVEMATTSEPDEGGYEEDADADGGAGDTTDEELVGDDDLPNERAMRLFNLPFSVSAINPMSTMSPTVSPGPRDRIPFRSQTHLDSPKPSDILSGKVFWDSDEPEEYDDSLSKSRSLSSSRSGPRTGTFEPPREARQAVIDGTNKEVPSPHPRFRGRGKSTSSLGRYNTVRLFCLLYHSLSNRHSLGRSPHSQAFTWSPCQECFNATVFHPFIPPTCIVRLRFCTYLT